jgi:hypothetical protein
VSEISVKGRKRKRAAAAETAMNSLDCDKETSLPQFIFDATIYHSVKQQESCGVDLSFMERGREGTDPPVA